MSPGRRDPRDLARYDPYDPFPDDFDARVEMTVYLLRLLARHLCPCQCHRHRRPAVSARVSFRPNPGEEPMAHQIPTGGTAVADVEFRDAAGNIASVDGVPEWSSSDDSIGTVTASDDGLSATVTANATGTAQVQLRADANLGDGVTELGGVADFEVVAAEAVSAVITFRDTTGVPTDGTPSTPGPVPEPAPGEPGPEPEPAPTTDEPNPDAGVIPSEPNPNP